MNTGGLNEDKGSREAMRIAILVPSMHGGGAEFVASQWASYLEDRGDSVVVLATHPNPGEPCERVHGVWFGERLIHLRKRLQRDSFDLVLALAPHWNLLAIVATRGIKHRPKVVISGRTIETEARRMGSNKAVEMFLARVWYPRADAFVAISHPTAAEAQSFFRIPREKLWVVPNPATAKLDASEALAPRPRRSSIAPGDPLEIVIPGRLVRGKRPLFALEVARHCAELSDRPVTVHFFGKGPEQSALEQASVPGVEVKLHGWVEQWYQEAPRGSVVLLSSQIEGFANVLVEAAAANLPSVACSRALGVADAMVPGVTGILTLTDNADELAAALLEAERLTPSILLSSWLPRFSLQSSGESLRRACQEVIKS